MSGRCPSSPQRNVVYIKQLHALGCLTDSLEAGIFWLLKYSRCYSKMLMGVVDFWFALELKIGGQTKLR